MSEALEAIKITSLSLGVLFALAYAYQLFYMVVALLKKPKTFSDSSPRKYAVLISARNEEKVIGNLIRSLKAQKYPEELLDIYVVADNCNDGTSKAATAAGAIVFERYNTTHVGKGYALDFLYSQIKASKRFADYDGFFIFDSDNLVDENFVYEMNKARGAGFNVITSYRNSKNYDDNWVTAGSSLWFIHESRQLNNARMILGTSAAASGTGFFVSKKLLESFGGWKFFMLTEDIEFSMRSILKGERIAYCEKAVIYDEQPRDFLQSWDQRVRWAKGNIACGKKYFFSLIKNFLDTGAFGSFDIAMMIMPAVALTFLSIIFWGAMIIISLLFFKAWLVPMLTMIIGGIIGSYFLALMIGALTLITDSKNINCPLYKKILYLFSFPVYMLTYAPISVVAVFSKAQWKPIRHNVASTLKDMKKA